MTEVDNKMEYVRMGRSGLKVSKLILGCASYGDRAQIKWCLGEEEGIGTRLQHIKLAYDLGINTFDTSNLYSNGKSEIILGKAIKKYGLPRDEIVVMTKVWCTVARAGENAWGLSQEEIGRRRYTNQQGLSRKHIFEAIKHSLERLQLDYVDVYQCHRLDPNTPIEETVHALHDVVQAGYARYIGMSSCYAWQFHKMQNYAKEIGLTQFISMQNLYNAIYREEEREMIPLLQDLGVGMIPWSPQAGGALAMPFGIINERKKTDPISKIITEVPFYEAVNQRIEAISKERNISMAQVTLAWSLSKPFITAPIFGALTLDELKDNCGAIHVKLTAEEIKSIDDLYETRAIFGHD